MHDGELPRRRRRIALQPAKRGSHDRLRLDLVLVDHAFPPRHFVAPAIGESFCSVEIAEADAGGICACDSPEILEELLADLLAELAIWLRIHDPTGRAILDLGHDEERSLERFRIEFERDGLWHRKAELEGCCVRAVFDRALRFDQARRRITTQDQRAVVGLSALTVARTKAIGLPRSAARNAREIGDLEIVCGEGLREVGAKPRA